MDTDKSTTETLEGWSDVVSMVLLGLALVVCGLSPTRPIWGRSGIEVVSVTTPIMALLIWTGFRFIYEGINTQGPREFLAGSVVYLARWLFLMLHLSCPWFEEARRFQVARALLKLHNLRAGPSTDGPRDTATREEREAYRRNYGRDANTGEQRIRSRNEWEVVMRQGVKRATDRTRPHWRGYMDPEPVWHPGAQAWDVTLWDQGMHEDKLKIFGTVVLMREFDAKEKSYSRFYKVVLTAVSAPRPPANGAGSNQGSSSTVTTEEPGSISTAAAPQSEPTGQPGSAATAEGGSVLQPHCVISLPDEGSTAQNESVPPVEAVQSTGDAEGQPQQEEIQASRRPEVNVNFKPFTDRWSGLRPELIANSVDATDMRPIGSIARRIAADAIAYIDKSKLEFRTPDQVAVLNRCLDDARRAQFSAFDVALATAQQQ